MMNVERFMTRLRFLFDMLYSILFIILNSYFILSFSLFV